MKATVLGLAVLALVATSTVASARGGHGGGRSTGSYSYSPGTGSKPSSTYVPSHIRKDGTYVEGHRRSTPDQNFTNNWSTKGNDNPYTGKDGSRVTPPAKQ